MHHHYNYFQSEAKRKADYRFTSTLITRSEWARLTPEEIERQEEERAEWAVKWNNLTTVEQFGYMGDQLKKALAHSIY
jgi:hypothetical protein